jgi:hypothetical protein
MSSKGKKKCVTQMHVVFDDGDEADWSLNNSMPWRYEKKVSRSRNSSKPSLAGKVAKAAKAKPVAKTRKTKPKVSKAKKNAVKKGKKKEPAKPKYKREFGAETDRRLHPPTPEELALQRALPVYVPRTKKRPVIPSAAKQKFDFDKEVETATRSPTKASAPMPSSPDSVASRLDDNNDEIIPETSEKPSDVPDVCPTPVLTASCPTLNAGFEFLASLKSDLAREKEQAIKAKTPKGATPISMATYDLVDIRSGRKTHWRLYGVSAQAMQLGKYVFAARAMRERPYPETASIICRDMVLHRWHEQFSAKIGFDIGPKGAMVCYCVQFVNENKAASHGSMITGRLEGPKMVIVYLLDTDVNDKVYFVPISAIEAKDVPTYEIAVSADVLESRDTHVKEWITKQLKLCGVLTRRVRANEEFRIRACGARTLAADLTGTATTVAIGGDVKKEERMAMDTPLSPMSALRKEHKEEMRRKDAEILRAKTTAKRRPTKTKAAKTKPAVTKRITTTARRVSTRKKKVINYADEYVDTFSDEYPPTPPVPVSKRAISTPTTDELYEKLMKRRANKRKMLAMAYDDAPLRGKTKTTRPNFRPRPSRQTPPTTGGLQPQHYHEQQQQQYDQMTPQPQQYVQQEQFMPPHEYRMQSRQAATPISMQIHNVMDEGAYAVSQRAYVPPPPPPVQQPQAYSVNSNENYCMGQQHGGLYRHTSNTATQAAVYEQPQTDYMFNGMYG